MALLTSSWCFDFAIVITSVFLAVWQFYKKSFKHWDKLKIKHTVPKFPFGDFGFSIVNENMAVTTDRIYRSFPEEKVVGMWNTFQPTLLVRDADVIKDVLVKEFMSFHDRGFYVNEKVDPLSAHLLALGGSKWKNLRAKLSPTFTSGKMKMMFPILVEISNELANVLEKHAANKDIVEMKEMLARYTTDVISSCAFGLEANSLKNPDAIFRNMGRKILEPSLPNALRAAASFNPKLVEYLKIKSVAQDVEDFFMGAVRDTIDHREKNNVKRNDFLQLLIQLKNKGKLDDVDEIKGEEENTGNKPTQTISFEEVVAQAFIFFIAGFETSSTTMQFALYEMAMNPDMQEKLRAEIKNTLAKTNGEITYEAVFGMDYLGRFIDETLRKYPVASILFRQSNKDYKLPDSDIVIPKGTTTLIPVYALHHDPKHYPDPERFDPNRFTEEVKSKRHHYAYLPFGDGPRNCIGMRFGLMQSRVGLVRLLMNYKFDICEKSPIPMVYESQTGILTPKGGMPLRISKL